MATQAVTPTATVVGEWMAELEAGGVTSRNREAHRTGVERLAEYMHPRSCEEATAADVRGFLAYLGQLGVSEPSRGVYRAILVKWMSHAAVLRERRAAAVEVVATAAAAAAVVQEAEPLGSPALPAPDTDDDATVVIDLDEASTSDEPVIELIDYDAEPAPARDDVVLMEGQAEATWPIPSRALSAEPAFVSAVDASPFRPLAFEPPMPRTLEPEAPLAVADAAQAPPREAPAAAALETPGFTFDLAMPAATEAPAVPPGDMFGQPITTLASAAGAAERRPAADDTPVKPFAPVVQAPAAPAFAGAVPRVASRDGQGSEHFMDSSVASIPLAHAPGPRGAGKRAAGTGHGQGDSVAPRGSKAPALAWGLRLNGHERHDLDLSQIRNMAATGALPATALIRRPGGEWTRAGDYQPLKSVFQQARLEAAGEADTGSRRGREPSANPQLTSALVFTGVALGCAGMWWFAMVAAGRELLPVAVLMGVASGVITAWWGRAEGLSAAGVAGACTLTALGLGCAAVYQTLATGVVGSASGGAVEALPYLADAFRPAALLWWGGSVLLSGAIAFPVAWLRKR